MKKLLFIAVSLLMSIALFAHENCKARYFFVTGWEYLSYPSDNSPQVKAQPVVSNVFSTTCKDYHRKSYLLGLQNEFNDYYSVYFSKSRQYGGLNRKQSYGEFETYEEAEKERRKVISNFNYNWDPLLVKDFSAGCD